jgi:2-oxo-3-hexenedioate decarboxylase
MTTDDKALAAISRDLLSARRARAPIAPPSASVPGFDLDSGYMVARLNFDALTGAGERPARRQIGFTHPRIWDQDQVYQPIWAHMYESTVRNPAGQDPQVPFAQFCSPRLEPEIMVKFARAPEAAEPQEIADALEWVAHGYEVVDCHFPDWKFAAADTLADFGLHGALFVGELVAASRIPDLARALSTFEIELARDGETVDRGRGSNVLDGPLQAIAHLMKLLETQPQFTPLSAGEIVTTGTLTAAWPVAAGQRWQTRLDDVGLPGASLRFV